MNGEVVGWVDADPDEPRLQPGEINLGYNVFGPHRNKGYASRALLLMLRWLSSNREHHTATLSIDRRNVASLGVAEKTGFLRTGETDDAVLFARPIRAV